MQTNSGYFSPPPVEGISGGGTGYGWIDASPKTTDGENKQSTSNFVSVWTMPTTANVGHQEQPRLLENVSIHCLSLLKVNKFQIALSFSLFPRRP